MSNPLEDYLSNRVESTKTASFPFAPGPTLRQAAGVVGHGALEGLGAAGVLAANGLASMAARAITKRRDFRQMLLAAPDIAQLHAEDPARINSYYDSVHRMAPQYSGDPYIAAHIVRNMATNPTSPGAGLMNLIQGSRTPERGMQFGFDVGNKGPSFSFKT